MANLFIFWALTIGVLTAQAEDIRVEFLDTPEAVNADMCRTHQSDKSGHCGLGYTKRMITISVPTKLALIFLKQVEDAQAKNFYDTIGAKDFFHGHFFLKGPQTKYDSLNDYFSDVTAELFHSAEYNSRWWHEGNAGIDLKDRRPRSFMGWLDGTVQSAIELFPEGFKFSNSYESSGTIYSDEVLAVRPELSSHYILSNRYPDIFVTACKGDDCRTCEIDNQLLIVNEPTGRFLTKNGENLDFYLRCFYAKE